MKCPECGFENLPGADDCTECSSSLTAFGLPQSREGLQKRLMEEPVGKLPYATPLFLKPEESLQTTLDTMRREGRGCVLIVENDQIKGIFTERDALVKCSSQTMDLKKARLGDFMTPNPEVLKTQNSMAYALNKMSVGGYRHLPIVDGKRILGVVRAQDFMRYFWG